MAENSHISTQEIAAALGVAKRTVLREIDKMKKESLVARVGSEKGGYWKALEAKNR